MDIRGKQIFTKNQSDNTQKQDKQLFKFTLSLYQKLAQTQNLIFSPASIYLTLAIAAIGSKNQTLEEFKKLLDFEDINQLTNNTSKLLKILQKNEKGIQTVVVNKILSGLPELKAEYLQLVNSNFGSIIEQVNLLKDFEQTRIQINEWVQQVTSQKIKDLLPPKSLNQSTAMVLVNAIYFKGDWMNQFDMNNTSISDFFLEYEDIGKKIKADIMKIEKEFDYYEDQSFQYAQIPYKGGEYCMEILLPKSTLENFEQTLTDQTFQRARMNKQNKNISLSLPKFKIQPEAPIDLQNILQELGIVHAFSNSADFSFMDPSKLIQISKIYHKSMIEVNENGSEAAAATVICYLLSKPKKMQLVCNKPFIYTITHTPSQTILFLGKLTDPSKLYKVY